MNTNAIRLLAAAVTGLGLVLAFTVSVRAQGSPIAQVKTVSGDAVIVRNGARLPARIGDPVFEQDTIETGADGSIGLTFTDNTVMSTGPNSELALKEYRFDSNNFNGSMLAEMRKGTLAVVSGDIARSTPGAMKIRIPTGIVGVRGTRFVIQANGD